MSKGATSRAVASRAAACVAALALVCCERLPRLESALGGDTTVADVSPQAFSFSARNLDPDGRRRFEVGDSFFNRNWVVAPASTAARDGLGPTFNAASCSSCHLRDGRAQPPRTGERGLIHRLSMPGTKADGSPLPVPGYGLQLPGPGDSWSASGGSSRGRVERRAWSARRRHPVLSRAAVVPLRRSGVRAATRSRPTLRARGPGAARQRPARGDTRGGPAGACRPGRSGRRRHLGPTELVGRSAHRPAGARSLRLEGRGRRLERRVAMARTRTSGSPAPGSPTRNCASSQEACLSAPSGGEPEMSAGGLRRHRLLHAHARGAGAALRRTIRAVAAGARLFAAIGCAALSRADFTHRRGGVPRRRSRVRRSIPTPICCCTTSAPSSPTVGATGAAQPGEWRTPPLWGIGLVRGVRRHAATCTTVARAGSRKRSCGTAARRRARATPSSSCRTARAPISSASSRPLSPPSARGARGPGHEPRPVIAALLVTVTLACAGDPRATRGEVAAALAGHASRSRST